jgi:hypothetical protein
VKILSPNEDEEEGRLKMIKHRNPQRSLLSNVIIDKDSASVASVASAESDKRKREPVLESPLEFGQKSAIIDFIEDPETKRLKKEENP